MKRKMMLVIAAVLLAVLGLALGSSLALGYDLWDSCRKNNGLCYYPGDCRDYTDTNKDGICDRSQLEPDTTTATTTTESSSETLAVITPSTEVSTGASASIAADDTATGSTATETDSAASQRSRYYLLPVLLVTAGLYGITWVLSNRGVISIKVHRRIWNVVLLIATVISALLGIYLILEIDFDVSVSMPFNPLFWHVEAGIAMGMIAVFHIAWHWRYFQKMLSRAQAGS